MNDENEVNDQVEDLIRELENSGDSEDAELAKKAKKLQSDREKFKKSISNLQESLDYLRISVKYLVFDLEATRRENEYLQSLLKEDEDEECNS